MSIRHIRVFTLGLVVAVASVTLGWSTRSSALPANHACRQEESALERAQAALTAAVDTESAARAALTTKEQELVAARNAMNANANDQTIAAYNAALQARDDAKEALRVAENDVRSKTIARNRAKDALQECLRRHPAPAPTPLPEPKQPKQLQAH